MDNIGLKTKTKLLIFVPVPALSVLISLYFGASWMRACRGSICVKSVRVCCLSVYVRSLRIKHRVAHVHIRSEKFLKLLVNFSSCSLLPPLSACMQGSKKFFWVWVKISSAASDLAPFPWQEGILQIFSYNLLLIFCTPTHCLVLKLPSD